MSGYGLRESRLAGRQAGPRGSHLRRRPKLPPGGRGCRGEKEEQKKLLRAASVLRRVQDQLLGENDVKAIQYQVARLHCLNYKPYNSEDEESNENRRAERAKRSVIMAITLNSYLFDVFNGVFKEVRKFQAPSESPRASATSGTSGCTAKGSGSASVPAQPRCQGSRRP